LGLWNQIELLKVSKNLYPFEVLHVNSFYEKRKSESEIKIWDKKILKSKFTRNQ